MIQKAYLVMKEILSARFISLIVLAAVCTSVLAFSMFEAIGQSFEQYIARRFASAIPPNTIRITRHSGKSVMFFQEEDPSAAKIDDKAIRGFRSVAGVKLVTPVLPLRVPTEARVNYMSLAYRTDLVAFGVPPAFVIDDLVLPASRRYWLRPDRDKPIPVLVTRAILQAFNDGLAGQYKIPRLSERGTLGLGFEITFGKAVIGMFSGGIKKETCRAEVAGFTDKINTLAIVLPLPIVEEYNRRFDESYKNEYSFVFIKVADHKSLTTVSERIKRMGFKVEAEKTVSEQIVALKENVALVIRAISSIFVALAIITVVFATAIATLSRVEYYRIMRIVGASKLFLSGTILFKYALLGAVGACAGLRTIEIIAGQFTGILRLSGILIDTGLSHDKMRAILIAGTLIPSLSTIPSILLLYGKRLNRD